MNVGIRDPQIVDFVLERGLPSLKMHWQVQGENKIKQGDDESKQTNIPIAPWKKQKQKRARQRNERDQREHRVIQRGADRVPVHTMAAITTAAPAAIQP